MFEKHGLGPRHVVTLIELAPHEILSVSELSFRLGVTLATTSLMVGELNSVGLVERREDPDDRRRTIVNVVAEFAPAFGSMIKARLELLARVMAHLEPDEHPAFIKGVRALVIEMGDRTTCMRSATLDE